MPAAPRRIVSATAIILLVVVYRPVSSCKAKMIGLPNRDCADEVTTSVCPYCAVGCSQRVFVRNGRITNIEGNPESPINRGRLCPKGAATFQLVTGTHRLDTVLHRRPGATEWEPIALDDAMDRVAQLIAETRDRTWEESDADGRPLRRSQGIAFMGGSTLDNEECYLLAKFWAQLGVLQVENQARI